MHFKVYFNVVVDEGNNLLDELEGGTGGILVLRRKEQSNGTIGYKERKKQSKFKWYQCVCGQRAVKWHHCVCRHT
jgi:hypothetical protein